MPLIQVKLIEGVFDAAEKERSSRGSPTPW